MTTALVLVPLIGAIIALLFAGCNAIKVKKANKLEDADQASQEELKEIKDLLD